MNLDLGGAITGTLGPALAGLGPDVAKALTNGLEAPSTQAALERAALKIGLTVGVSVAVGALLGALIGGAIANRRK